MYPRTTLVTVLLCSAWLLFAGAAAAQETDRNPPLPVPSDTTAIDSLTVEEAAPGDETLTAPGDTLDAEGLPSIQESTPPTASSDSRLKEPVTFSAADSLVIEFDGEQGDRGSLYGEAGVVYGNARLNSHRVDILFEIDELHASGQPSDTGMVGRPQFEQAGEAFTGERLAFNLRTERGRVTEAQTAIQEGFVRASAVKVAGDNVYVAEGVYTTCECVDDPSYSLRSSKMKIVDEEWIYTGPIRLYIFNIPTPLWLPFGFLPAREGRRSGPLPPRYGQDELGFYLRDWGWYQAINDYMDFQMQLGFWTSGSWQVHPSFRYNRRYRYRGQLSIDYTRNRLGEREDPDYTLQKLASLRWNHQQELSPSANFSGDVNFTTSGYLRAISQSYEDRVKQTINSSIRYNKNWSGSGRRLSANLNHRQVLATGQVDMTLPELSFSQSDRKPFKSDTRVGGREAWYEKIMYSYGGSLHNQYQFVPLSDDTLMARGDTAATDISWTEALFSPSKFRRATGNDIPLDFKVAHRVRSGANFTMNRIPIINRTFRLNFSPNFSYTEDWYTRTTRKHFSEEENRVVTEIVPDFLPLRQFNAGVSANTTFYGMFPVGLGPFQGLRHTVRPSLSFNYKPDFERPFWGYTDTYIDAQGNEVRYDRVRGIQRGRQQALTFSLDNVFETKRVRRDTTGEQRSSTVPLLNLDLSSSYNFAQDSLRLSNIRMNARTRLFERVDVRANATFDPYTFIYRDDRAVRINRFLVQEQFSLARLTQFNITVASRFSSRRSGPGRPSTLPFSTPSAADPDFGFPDFDGVDPFGTPFTNTSVGYADFAIPWSLSVDFTYSLVKPFDVPQTRATVNSSFDLNLTPRWKVQGRTGYDFKENEVVFTSIAILRDFECWEMAINWIPFGDYQSYSFDLRVKSGHLRDILRLRQPRSDVRGRFNR